MLAVRHFWCVCDYPAGSGLEPCDNCGLIRETTPEQDRETADVLGDVARGKTRLDPSGGGRPSKET